MKPERRKILEMLSNGCIDSKEAQLLLDTLNEIQVESKLAQVETIFDFSLDLKRIKMLAKEYGRFPIPQPTAPQTPPTPYFSWRPV